MKNIGIFLFLIFFGIPFLAVSDLFPFHRFGMFAQLPVSSNSEFLGQIQIKKDGKWQKAETGNAYLDKNYFPLWANRAMREPEFKKRLLAQFQKNGTAKADSIRFVSQPEMKSILQNPER